MVAPVASVTWPERMSACTWARLNAVDALGQDLVEARRPIVGRRFHPDGGPDLDACVVTPWSPRHLNMRGTCMQASDGALAATARRSPDDAGRRSVRSAAAAHPQVRGGGAGAPPVCRTGRHRLARHLSRVAIADATAAGTQPAAPTLAIRPEQSLRCRRGAEVRSISLSGNRLAVHYEAGGAAGIAIFDLQTGRMVTDIAVEPKPAGQRLNAESRACGGPAAKKGLIEGAGLPYRFALALSRSSSGLGHQPLTLGTGVRVPYGAPPFKKY